MYYPPIPNEADTVSALKFISRKLKEDRDFLSGPKCPYSSELVNWLQDTLVAQQINNVGAALVNNGDLDVDADIDIELESTTLFREMKTFKTDLTKADVNEKAAMFRTMTSLMEKIINIKERASALKNFGLFEQLMLDAIDNYLEPKERTALLDSLEKLRG